MKLKKVLSAILICALFFSVPVNIGKHSDAYADSIVNIYAPDGRYASIYESELETYLNLGWYKSYDEVIKTIYAPDGRCIRVYMAELETYLSLGWYASYEEVTKSLYAPDGRVIVVYKAEVDTYLNLGWSLYVAADPSKPMVALSFDDGPSPNYTKRIVDTLAANNASATFFVVGNFLAKYPDVAKYASKNGMEIANHSYSHRNLGTSSISAINNELTSTYNMINSIVGIAPTLVRPPYGSLGNNLKNCSKYPLILWSIDTRDWESRNAWSVYNTVAGKVKDGDIILMHDLYASTADAVDMIVPYLKEQGFQIVSVSSLARAKGYSLNAGQAYRAFR